MSKHIHLHFNDALHIHPDFKEEEHPRGKGGKFARTASRGAGAVTGAVKRGAGSVGGAASNLASRTAQGVKKWGHEFGEEDLHILHSGIFESSSGPRKNLASRIVGFAKSLPHLIANMGREEEKQKFVGASKALNSWAHGRRADPAHVKSFRKACFTVMVSTLTTLLHGDPTGSSFHILMALGQELADHTMLEHGAGTTVGALKLGYHKLTGKPIHVHVHDDMNGNDDGIDYNALQQFFMKLAKNIETKEVTPEMAKRILAQSKQNRQNGGTQGVK